MKTKPKYRELLKGVYMNHKEVLNPLVKRKDLEPTANKFRAFEFHDLDELRVVILGQDPYHTKGVATGLSFNVEGSYCPPSLRNIKNKIEEEFNIKTSHENILNEDTARQGVLLLNTALTVERGDPNSHKKEWLPFTKDLIEAIIKNTEDVVWILWGANAIDLVLPFEDLMLENNHQYIASSHPSPFSVDKKLREFPPFKKETPFSTANSMLEFMERGKINWTGLPDLEVDTEEIDKIFEEVITENSEYTEELIKRARFEINGKLMWLPDYKVTAEVVRDELDVLVGMERMMKQMENEMYGKE